MTASVISISRPLIFLLTALSLLLASATPAQAHLSEHPGADEFVARVASEHGLPEQWITDTLAGAERQQAIIDAMTRPAEGKPWYEYRPIFITERRVKDGVAFWLEHADTLGRASDEFGVPEEIIVAIIGVETSYGRITGKWRVLDALVTLGFHYPPRSKFFLGELEKLFVLAQEENLPIEDLLGSYAGAMGFGQFIPSSYRAYAVDFDGDGVRDLWSPVDAIGSVANYFARHHWRPGAPVTDQVTPTSGARELEKLKLKPEFPVAQFREWGYGEGSGAADDDLATLIDLELEQGREYWLGYHNFYVISRYNHSALYSMAVWQLSRQILAARELTGAGS